MTAERDLDLAAAAHHLRGGEGGGGRPLLALHPRPRARRAVEQGRPGRHAARSGVPLGKGIAGSVAESGAGHQHPRRLRRHALQPLLRRRHAATAPTPSSACPMRDASGEVTGVLQALNKPRRRLHRRGRGAAARARRPGRRRRSRTPCSTRRSTGCSRASSRPRWWRSSRGTRPPPVTPAAWRRSPSDWPEALEHQATGPLRPRPLQPPRTMQEMRYASLLHDFGKVGVREHVLVKAEKLYPHELEVLRARFAAGAQGPAAAELQRAGSTARARAASCTAAASTRGGDRAARRPSCASWTRRSSSSSPATGPPCSPRAASSGSPSWRGAALPGRARRPQRRCCSTREVQLLSIPRGIALAPRSAGDREPRQPHLPLPLADPVDARRCKRVPEIAYAHHEKLERQAATRARSPPRPSRCSRR